MRSWLTEREDDPAEVERVVGFLTGNLALDDVRFSHAFASDKRELAGWGAERIETVLRRRGVAGALAREAACGGGETEVERAVRVLEERGSRLGTDRDRSRALGLLARRGYSAEDAYAAIRTLERAA